MLVSSVILGNLDDLRVILGFEFSCGLELPIT